VGWLGLPRDVVDVLLLCFAQNGAGAGHLLKTRVISGLYTPNQIIVSAVLVTTFVPCVAHLGALRKEMGAKTAAVMIVCIMLSALVLSGIVHHSVAFLMGGK
jgi:ferrous iron transport protein B